jgi:hypothetical protein
LAQGAFAKKGMLRKHMGENCFLVVGVLEIEPRALRMCTKALLLSYTPSLRKLLFRVQIKKEKEQRPKNRP